MAEKPSVLIVGGMGYIGRFLALYIHENNLASDVRLVDKVLPQLAWLAPEFSEACAQSKFVQADACQAQSLPRIFDRADGKEFDYVFNCAGETRYSQDDEIYKLRVVTLAQSIGKEAAKRGVKAFVELSSGLVYKSDSTPRKETDKLKPAIKHAQYKMQAEEELAKIGGLNLIIMRLAFTYGKYDSKFVSKGLVLARVYKHLGEELKWLWTKDLKVNTVHVDDVARALWAACEWQAKGKAGWDASTMGTVPTFNVVDHTNTNQGQLATHITEIYDIKTGFVGSLLSTFARMNMDHVLEDINEHVMGPWADLLSDAGITRPGPLGPYLEKEQLKDEDLYLDGSRFESLAGFTYSRPTLGKKELEEMIESYKTMNWWP
ncbi:hypothetical protein V494_04811 [Pseudogymnoascus sp. VKM F-4513 (FW-928)]|nr:hypothetical protein V494_04811 [Pseudogymnoascus sp. VKM F-4513 (FW-928)]